MRSSFQNRELTEGFNDFMRLMTSFMLLSDDDSARININLSRMLMAIRDDDESFQLLRGAILYELWKKKIQSAVDFDNCVERSTR